MLKTGDALRNVSFREEIRQETKGNMWGEETLALKGERANNKLMGGHEREEERKRDEPNVN